jgi:serine protease Do
MLYYKYKLRVIPKGGFHMNKYFSNDNDDKNQNVSQSPNEGQSQNEVFASELVDENQKGSQYDAENPANNTVNIAPQGSPVTEPTAYGAAQGTPSDAYGVGYYGASQGSAGDGSENNTGDANQSEYNPYGGNVQYKWNYDDYQKALNDKGKQPKKKKKGLRAFVISLCAVLAVAVVSLAGVEISNLLKDGLPSFGIGSGLGGTSASAINPNGPTLKTTDKPTTSSVSTASSSTAGAALQMTAGQVYSTVKNSVVVIETYDDLSSLDPSAEGSGIIMSTDGYIITNEHVIDGAQNVKVVLPSGKEYTAAVKGSDLRTDLAVLKIDATGLTAATFGNSDQLGVAETVLAVGNPAGLGGSVTQGIVSALNMSVTTESNYTEKCIQTDAPINPGNSGGALVNMYGQVVGITSSKIEATGYEGMGFAIPINTAKPVIDDIIKYGYVTGRVKIGISVKEYDTTAAAAQGYPAGLLITDISSTSDAATKGIQKGDVITKINDIAATTYDAFYAEESKHKAGETVKLTVFRKSTNSTFDVNIKLAEDKGDASATTSSSSQSNSRGYSTSPYGN